LDLLNNVTWLGHSSIRIIGVKTLYIDPFRIESGPPADIILITHEHYDHFDPGSISKIRTPETIVIAPLNIIRQLSGATRLIKPGEQIIIDSIIIRAVPSYNIGKRYHPRENQNVGYIIETNQLTYYHAGDTDLIPEIKKIQADVIFLPVGGTFTMDAAEAAQAAQEIRPQVAVPIHWGTVCGTRADAEKFVRLAHCKAVILNKGK